MGALREFGNGKIAHSCTSENMDVVEIREDLDDELGGKVLDRGVHVYGVESGIWKTRYGGGCSWKSAMGGLTGVA